MSGQGYDPARLALMQEVIRRKVDAGDTDDAIKESLLWEWNTSEQQQQIYGYLRALRLVAPQPVDDSEAKDARDLPGNVSGKPTWANIEATYRKLAGERPGWRSRRRRPGEPSRPEVAKALDRSVSTLKRACVAEGKGTKWPPAGL